MEHKVRRTAEYYFAYNDALKHVCETIQKQINEYEALAMDCMLNHPAQSRDFTIRQSAVEHINMLITELFMSVMDENDR